MTVITARKDSRAAALDRNRAMQLAATEYQRFADLLSALAPQDWDRPTECPGWDVRTMAGHVLGMAEMVSSLRQFAVQNAGAARAGGGIDALTAVQVRREAGLSPAELVDRFTAVAPLAVRGRRRFSRAIGALNIPEDQVVGQRTERWRFGFLFDVILTRDTWMHRVDITRATGRELVLTPDHDGMLVADVVAEWAQRHGRPYRLRLTGPAGGSWAAGDGDSDGDSDHELDAVEFCRVLSGRGQGAGMLAEQVPF